MSHRLQEWCWEAFRDQVPGKFDTVLLPVGTLEAHGGIPLGTDNIIPEAMAGDLAPRVGALIAPTIPFGVTNSLLPYPGSTTVSSATFEQYLFEAAAGLVDTGFRRVVLLNGHGGQTGEVHQVVRRLWDERKAFAAAIEWWGLAQPISREIYGEVTSGHAGVEETAMVLAVTSGMIDEARHERARRLPVRPGVKARPFPATVLLFGDEVDGNGAPILDKDKAEQFYRRVVDRVAEALDEIFTGWNDLGG